MCSSQPCFPFGMFSSYSNPSLSISTPSESDLVKLANFDIPKPRAKMRSLNWTKIPSQKVLQTNQSNLWSLMVTNSKPTIKTLSVDFETLEELFCQPNSVPPPTITNSQLASASFSSSLSSSSSSQLNSSTCSSLPSSTLSSSNLSTSLTSSSSTSQAFPWAGEANPNPDQHLPPPFNRLPPFGSNGSLSSITSSFHHPTSSSSPSQHPCNGLDRKKNRHSGEMANHHPPQETINLNILDGKKSLSVNIFLKQFRGSTDELINLISTGDHSAIGSERLRSLMKLLPEASEKEQLTHLSSERSRMPIAEKFLTQLITIPKYQLRIECMLVKEEFDSNVASLEPSISIIKTAANEIKVNENLRNVMYLILVAGNFLNSGGYAGDAVGFKMMSLTKLSEIRGNKPGFSLIHYVAREAVKKNIHGFLECLGSFEEAAKISIDSLKDEIKGISSKITSLKKTISSLSGGLEHFFLEMSLFLDAAAKEIDRLTVSIEIEIERTRIDLAQFLCEDISTFKLDECFSIFAGFCSRFKLACDENERRREVEAKNERRRKNLASSATANENRKYVITETEANGGELILSGSNTLPRIRASRSALNESSNSTDDDLANGLMELLKSTNDLSGSIYDSAYGSLRRVGSGRRSINRGINSYHPESSRERVTHDGVNGHSTLSCRPNEIECNIFEIPEEPKTSRELTSESENEVSGSERSSKDRKPGPKEVHQSQSNGVKSSSPSSGLTLDLRSQPEPAKDIRSYWKSLDTDVNCDSSKSRIFTNLSNQPTAVITPTQVEPSEERKGLARRPNILNPLSVGVIPPLSMCDPILKRNPILSPTSTNSTAAYVKPIQLTERSKTVLIERSVSSASSCSSSNGSSTCNKRSRVPVRKDSLTKPPKPLNCTENEQPEPLNDYNNNANGNDKPSSRIHSTSVFPLRNSNGNAHLGSKLFQNGRTKSSLRPSPIETLVNRNSRLKTSLDRSRTSLASRSSLNPSSNPARRTYQPSAESPPTKRIVPVSKVGYNGEGRSFMRQTSSSAAKSNKPTLARFRF